MENRVVLHSDMNSFYASVEAMLDPSLKGKAVAVCGSTEDRHGIVLAKSEKAKKAGVKTGMVSWQAKQHCRDLILVPPQYDQYLKYSKMAREIYSRYTDLIEPFGMDECWLDVSGSMWRFSSPLALADELRNTIREELGLTVSIGVSFNKIFAKLGSDMKKPDAVTEITQENFKTLVWPLAASEMIYVGHATEAKLARHCVHTIGDLAAVPDDILQSWFGINGHKLWLYANGLDRSRVAHKDFENPIKSVGHGVTCTADLRDPREVHLVLLELAQDVGHRLRVHQLTAHGVQISVRRSDLTFEQYQCRLPITTQLPCELEAAAFKLFQQRYDWHSGPVRALTIRAIDLLPKEQPAQLYFFVDEQKRQRREKLEDAVESLRQRFGKTSLTYASLLENKKIPSDGRDLVKMPGMMYQ